MRRSALAACCGAAAFLTAGSGSAAHENTTLDVRATGSAVTIATGVAPAGGPPAILRIFTPRTTKLSAGQAPGTILGSARTQLGDELFVGRVLVARPGEVESDAQASCVRTETVGATWLLRLRAAGRTLVVPVYLIPRPSQSGVGSAAVHLCVPANARLQRLELSIAGVFSPVTGAWIAVWLPYKTDGTTLGTHSMVAAGTEAAAGEVSLVARSVRGGTALQGRVVQGGRVRKDATVTIFGGARADRFRRLGRVRVGPAGRYRFLAETGTVFRARASAATRLEQVNQYCFLGDWPWELRAPCTVTSSGFTARSAVVRRASPRP